MQNLEQKKKIFILFSMTNMCNIYTDKNMNLSRYFACVFPSIIGDWDTEMRFALPNVTTLNRVTRNKNISYHIM